MIAARDYPPLFSIQNRFIFPINRTFENPVEGLTLSEGNLYFSVKNHGTNVIPYEGIEKGATPRQIAKRELNTKLILESDRIMVPVKIN